MTPAETYQGRKVIKAIKANSQLTFHHRAPSYSYQWRLYQKYRCRPWWIGEMPRWIRCFVVVVELSIRSCMTWVERKIRRFRRVAAKLADKVTNHKAWFLFWPGPSSGEFHIHKIDKLRSMVKRWTSNQCLGRSATEMKAEQTEAAKEVHREPMTRSIFKARLLRKVPFWPLWNFEKG